LALTAEALKFAIAGTSGQVAFEDLAVAPRARAATRTSVTEIVDILNLRFALRFCFYLYALLAGGALLLIADGHRK